MVSNFEESIIWEREVKSQVNSKVLSQRYIKEVMGAHKSPSNSDWAYYQTKLGSTYPHAVKPLY